MIEIGRLCVKIAGRDAGKKCVIVDILDERLVLIDGETRRRKCNVLHLEPLDNVIKIKKNASHEDVGKELEKLGLKIRETKPKAAKEKQKHPEAKKEKKPKTEKKPAKAKPKKEATLEEKASLEEKPKKARKKAD